ncbi:uncharacterized protein LOC117565979 isoform X1 [Drosophila albomicans]|uniref:Uncharacterized protein LOC117565979 isoform X1 n=1 Tax=Drosophila albomicans TaxID=7291 RepID=A0A6P8WPK6_DROAB|nr:uncharacterized protein LOC117565979 isoform X1 [Drosophila albomicans]
MYPLLRRFLSGSISSVNQANLLRGYASFTVQDVMREVSDETGTLLIRFAKHIAVERYKCEEHVLPPSKVRYSDYFPITDERYFRRTLQSTQANQLPSLIIHASSYRSNAPAPMYVAALNALDAHALAQLKQMDTSTVLESLYAFLFLMPNWLRRMDFYHAAMRRLSKETSCSKERFLQICFYLGLQKQLEKNDLEALLASRLNAYLPSFNSLDLALVSNASYKTSTLVSGQSRDAYEAALVDAILNVKLVPNSSADALLICFIKAMRLQRVQDERVVQYLQNICLNTAELSQLQPRGLAHIFAYFSEMRWDHSEVVQAIVEQLLQYKPFELRTKDLATFIWCCAQLDCALSTTQLKQLEIVALRKLDHGEYDRFPDQLVDTCLSLCILGHYSKQLFDAAERLKANQRQRLRVQPKVDSRLTVLRSAVAIEHPEWLDVTKEQVFKKFARAPGYLLKQREDLTEYANLLAKDAEVEGVDIVCPIAGINLPSLRVQAQGDEATVYFVELLSEYQTLKFSGTANSLIRLKRRLLEALGHQVVLLQSGEMASNAQALHQLLEQATTSKTEDRPQLQGLKN